MTRPARMLVVVPAHDEEAVVERGLRALLAVDPTRLDLRVLVVPNGCTDATADRARGVHDPRVEVVELARGSKVGAVRVALGRAGAAGESAPGGEEPDVLAVVDADVVLDDDALPALAEALAVPEARIAAPGLRMDVSDCGPFARRYHAVWAGEPHVQHGDIGARGVYAVNRAGLARLAGMPEVINDDGWARASFAPWERIVTAGTSTVRPARGWWSLVQRRARILAGSRQLAQVLPPERRPGHERSRVAARTARDRLRQDGPLGAAVWYAVDLPARLLDRRRRRRGTDVPWGQDGTTR